MAYNKNNRGFRRDSEQDAPVTFRDGMPVYRGGRSEENDTRSYGKPSYAGGGARKPFRKREDELFEKKPYGKREDNFERKPYGRRDDGFEKKPYGKKFERDESGFERKPYGKKFERDESGFERKPYGRRDEGEERYGKKPYERENGRKPHFVREEQAAPVREDELPLIAMGRQAVKESIKSGRSINSILVTNEQDGSLGEIVTLARDAGIQVRTCVRGKLDEICMPFGHGGRTGNHQGIIAYLAGVDYCGVGDILAYAQEKNEAPFVILLDGVEDPYNLGSIIRSAECAGAHGVIIPTRRSAAVTAAVMKASAGAAAHMKVARVTNIKNAMEKLRDAGVWIVGADMDGTRMDKVDMKGATAIVIGGEGGGLSAHVKENCDFVAAIPMAGQLNSLNAAVAAAVLMFEKRRQDVPLS